MVEIIGVATIVALCWVLASSLAGESDSEKRRLASPPKPATGGDGARAKHAA